MAVTRSIKETVQARAGRDAAFRDALLTGDIDAGKAILRDYINATVGFGHLATATGMQPKSLMRVFGPGGNPTAKNLMTVIGELQLASGVSLRG